MAFSWDSFNTQSSVIQLHLKILTSDIQVRGISVFSENSFTFESVI